jgi:uncharacterized membrane protein YczE
MIKQKKAMSTWVWIVIALILIGVGIGIYFWLTGGSMGDWGTLDSIPKPPTLPE